MMAVYPASVPKTWVTSSGDAPSRKPQIGTYTPVLASDGSDLAAASQTIREIGAGGEMDAAIADAFSGARVGVSGSDGYFEIEMRQHGLLRPLKASELSDGTLRYAAATRADGSQRTRNQPAS
jgi:predicted ATPase